MCVDVAPRHKGGGRQIVILLGENVVPNTLFFHPGAVGLSCTAGTRSRAYLLHSYHLIYLSPGHPDTNPLLRESCILPCACFAWLPLPCSVPLHKTVVSLFAGCATGHPTRLRSGHTLFPSSNILSITFVIYPLNAQSRTI